MNKEREVLYMKKAYLGYQVYSAREDAAKDLLGTLKQIAAMGYDGVELAGMYGHSAKEIRAMLDETGLVAISSHVPLAEIREDMFKVISDHLTLGCEYIAVPYLDETSRPGSAGFAQAIRTIYDFATLCLQAGIQLLYHNHDFEFVSMSNQFGLDFLYDCVPEDLLMTELDTCWVKYAGQDPVEYIHKYAGRCPVVHLKDFVGRRIEGRNPYALIGGASADADVPFMFKPVGYGCQDVKAIVDAGLESGAEWFIVEQDLSPERPALESAKMSADTVLALL